MGISEVFIRRPIATALLMVGILVFGMAVFTLLPIAALPNVDFPTIVVSATLPGASPKTMAASVATPLEQQFAVIPGLAQMSSTSGLGTTSITLQFDLARNIDGAAEDVQTAINAASGLLPKNLPTPPTFKKTNPADRAILIYAVSSDAMPIQNVDQYAYNVLAESLSRVNGVSQVNIAGQQIPATHVQVDPDALASRGISLEDVRTALANATTDLPKGNLEGERQEFTLDTNDQLFDAGAFGNIIAAYRNGAPVYIKDVGKVVNSSQSARTGAWYDGKRIELLIERQPGANTIKVVDQIKAMMPELEASIPPSVHVDLVSDRSINIRDSVSDVEMTLMITIGLVVLTIFVFLRKVWATIIPSVTVPLALVATAGVMYVVGFNLDNISLMALTIAVGFVVDDAIVMIENIVRYIERGESPFQAAIRGAGQVCFTIVSITFSLIAVFIPLLFMGGIIGRLFREFAVTVSVAVVASAFVALTLTPMMCSRFLSHESETTQPGRLSRMAEGFFNAMLHGYDRGLRWVFRHQPLMLASTLGLIVLTGYLYVTIPKGFIPQQDTGFIFGALQARLDASFNTVGKLVNAVSAVILKDPAMSGVVGFAGAAGSNPSESTARMFIQLSHSTSVTALTR
jgi:multidrug efflux pump subunit AcrB